MARANCPNCWMKYLILPYHSNPTANTIYDTFALHKCVCHVFFHMDGWVNNSPEVAEKIDGGLGLGCFFWT